MKNPLLYVHKERLKVSNMSRDQYEPQKQEKQDVKSVMRSRHITKLSAN